MRVTFDGIAAGGEAVGRDEAGRACFAPFAAPGDVGLVQVQTSKKNFARGTLVSVEQASPQRVQPPCPVYRPATPSTSCGGCQLQHLQYSAQLEAKAAVVQNALQRIGGLRDARVEPCEPSPPWGYRNKADLVLGLANRPGERQSGAPKEPRLEMGYFARETHDIVDIHRCPLQLDANNLLLSAVRRILEEHPHWCFDPASGQGELRRIVLRTSSLGQSLLTLVTSSKHWTGATALAERMMAAAPGLVGVRARGPRHEGGSIAGLDFLTERVAGLDFRVSGEGFFQVNPVLTERMVQLVRDMTCIQGGERVLDLYCGVGLFGLALAGQGAALWGIEMSQAAVCDARYNASQHQREAHFFAGDTAKELARFKAGQFDTVILDPPRAGAAEAMNGLLALAAPNLVYISCDPATLARDAAKLVASGYELRRAVPLDLFPQTAHVETITQFVRRGAEA